MKNLEELGITPTPWKVDNRYIASKDSTLVAIMTGSTKHAEQDARMVAAAPELYEALQSLVEYIDRECVPSGENACEIMFKARAALAKASGESEGQDEN